MAGETQNRHKGTNDRVKKKKYSGIIIFILQIIRLKTKIKIKFSDWINILEGMVFKMI